MLEIDGYRIDAEIESTHSRRAEVSMHPVEDGVEIADHVRPEPLEVTVVGVVSSRPIGEVAELRDGDPVSEALSRLTEIYGARQPVTIRTSIDEYRDMVMQSLTIPKSAEIGDVIEFTAVFVQVKRVTNERTTIPVGLPVAAKVRNRGTLSPREQVLRGGRIVDPEKPIADQIPPVTASPQQVIDATSRADRQQGQGSGLTLDEISELTGVGF